MKRNFKTLLSVVMAIAMITAMLPFTAFAADWTERTNEVDMRVAVISDTHVESESKSAWFKSVLGDLKSISSNLDGVAMIGDIIYTPATGTAESMAASYSVVKSAYSDILGDVPYVWTMGNHEFPVNVNTTAAAETSIQAFTDNVGNPVSSKEINGYTFITANPSLYNGTMAEATQTEVMNLAKAAIEADTTGTKPVFVLIHHPTKDIYYGKSAEYGYTDEFYEFLRSTPQIVFISGHVHASAYDPRTVSQVSGGYSMISAPFCANGELSQKNCTVTEAISTNNDETEVSESMLLEVSDDVVKVYRMDNIGNRYIGEPYVLDIPAMVKGTGGYIYTDARYDNAKAPSFNEGATVTAIANADNSLTVTFSTDATMTESFAGAQDGFVYSYQIAVWDADKNYVIKSFKTFGDFWMQDADKPSTKTVTVSGLDSGETYTIAVSPVSAFQKVGESIDTKVTMLGDIAEDTRTLVAQWDMKTVTGNATDGYMIADNTANDNQIYAQYGSTFSNDYVGTSQYAKAKYMSMKHGPFNVYEKNAEGVYSDSLSADNAILKAIDSQFTFETWIYVPSTNNPNQISTLFDVHFDADGTRANATRVASLATNAGASEGTRVSLIMRRSYATSETYYSVGSFPKDSWNHVLVSYDCTKTSNKPFVVINGVVQSVGNSQLNASGAMVQACGTVDKNADSAEDKRSVEFAYHLAEWGSPVINYPKYGYTAFYQGTTSTTTALKSYYNSLSDYETEFDVKMYDVMNNLITRTDLDKVKATGNYVTVDFTGVDKETVTKDNVHIADVTENTFVDYTASWNGDTYTINDFALTDKHEYELVIKNIYDADGNLIRTKPQTVEFVCDETTNLAVIGQYEFDKSIFEGKGMYSYYPLPEKNGGSVPLKIQYNSTTFTEVNELLEDSPYAFTTNYPEMKIENADFAKSLDGAFTYETYIKFDKATDNNPFRYDMSGILMVGGDTTDFGDGHLKIYAGRTSASSNEAYLYFVKNAKNATEGGKALYRRWYAADASGNKLTLKQDKYYHLVVSYDPTSTDNMPVFYIDGVKYGTAISESSSGYPGAGFYTSSDMTDSNIYIGKLTGTTYYNDSTWAMSSFYTGVATSYDVYKLYETAKAKYVSADTEFAVLVTNYDGETVTDYENLRISGNTIKIDFTGVNKESVKEDSVYISDLTDNKQLDYTGTWNENIYVISDFTLEDSHKYNLVIKNIYDADGNLIRTKPQTVEFICDETELETLAKYDIASQADYKNMKYTWKYSGDLADKNGGSVPLHFESDGKFNKIYSDVIGSYYGFKANYPENYIASEEFAKSFDSAFTYETYIKFNKATDANPFRYSMSGILMVGGDTTDFGDGHLKIYAGRTSSSSNKAYLYFIKNAKNATEGGKALYRRWYAVDASGNKLTINQDKYYHLVVSYDPSSTDNMPVFYIDGVKYGTAISESSSGYPGAGFYTSSDMTDSNIYIGKLSANTNYADTTWAMSGFYQGVATDYDVNKMYEAAKVKYESYDVKLATEDGTEVTADNISDVSAVKASITVTSKETTPTVIMAVYNGGKLKDIKTGTLTSTATDAYTWETELTDIQAGDTVKVMCWNSVGSLSPILSTVSELTKQ